MTRTILPAHPRTNRTASRALGLALALPLSVVLFGGVASAAQPMTEVNPYAATATTVSGNGNGNGNAVGKPLAGTVGNADNKNPRGQAPGGSDGNNGYECDGNSGIARQNPAHTSCAGDIND